MKSRILISSIGLAFLIPFFLFHHAHQLHGGENTQANVPSSWQRAKDAIDRLYREPSSVTAAEFYASISSGKWIDDEKTAILDYIFGPNPSRLSSSVRYGGIAMEMLSGDIYAARSAIRLLGFVYSRWQSPPSFPSDEAELIMTTVGMLVRVNPGLFLKACHEEQEDPYLKDKGFPVAFVPDIMNEVKTRASYELEMRTESLRSVKAPELRFVREECLKALDKKKKKYGSDSPGSAKRDEGSHDDPRAKINYVFAEMQNRPSPENMKRVLALFSEVPSENLRDIVDTLSPRDSIERRLSARPLDLVRREALCGNEYALELLFRALVYFGGLDSMQIYSAISNLILMKPGLFIEKLAKYNSLLDVERICKYWGSFELPGVNPDVILKKRIDALAALSMPKYQELVDRCIRVIQNSLKDETNTKSSEHQK